MEDVIVFLLFAYLFVIRPILKRYRKAAVGHGDGPRSTLKRWLDTLQQKLREAAEQTSSRPTGERVDEVMDGGEVVSTEFSPSPLPSAPIRRTPRAGARYIEGDPPTIPDSVLLPPTADAVIQSQIEGAEGQASALVAGALRINLRQAVVWSEILGRPLALRDY